MTTNRSFIHAASLVAGTCIGGAVLAQPAQVAHNGLLPSLLVIALCALFMGLTALLILEASSRLPAEVHLPTIANTYLSWPGKSIAVALYLFIAYASLVAYISACSDLLVSTNSYFQQDPLGQIDSSFYATLTCCIIAALILLPGHVLSARINTLSVVALLVIFATILTFGLSSMEPHRLLSYSFTKMDHALGIFLAAFSFQMIVPSLRQQLPCYKSLQKAIVVGVGATALVYSIWLAFIFGIIPKEGSMGLFEMAQKELPITLALIHLFPSSLLAQLLSVFTLLALATSFLGISLGLYDFLEDFLRLKQSSLAPHPWPRRLLLIALIIAPTFLFSMHTQHLFATALDLTGGFGDTILNGIMPVAMVAIGLARWGEAPYSFARGKEPLKQLALVGCTLFFLYSLWIETVKYL